MLDNIFYQLLEKLVYLVYDLTYACLCFGYRDHPIAARLPSRLSPIRKKAKE
jgi:hypothetical protein